MHGSAASISIFGSAVLTAMFKIIGGGTRPDVHMCNRCAAAMVTKGPTESSDKTFCTFTRSYAAQLVTSCNKYRSVDESEATGRFSSQAYTLDRDYDGKMLWYNPQRELVVVDGTKVTARARMRRRRTIVSNPSISIN